MSRCREPPTPSAALSVSPCLSLLPPPPATRSKRAHRGKPGAHTRRVNPWLKLCAVMHLPSHRHAWKSAGSVVVAVLWPWWHNIESKERRRGGRVWNGGPDNGQHARTQRHAPHGCGVHTRAAMTHIFQARGPLWRERASQAPRCPSRGAVRRPRKRWHFMTLKQTCQVAEAPWRSLRSKIR